MIHRLPAQPRPTRLQSLAVVFATLAMMLPLASCDDDDDEPTLSLWLDFIADDYDPGPNSLSLQDSYDPPGEENRAFVAIAATQIPDLYGVTYELVWFPEVAAFHSAFESTHLSTGYSTVFETLMVGEGRLRVVHTRVGNVPGASGSGELHYLAFDARGVGTCGVFIENLEVIDSNGNTIPGVQTAGGRFETSL